MPSEGRGTLNVSNNLFLKANARIWPWQSYVFHIRSTAGRSTQPHQPLHLLEVCFECMRQSRPDYGFDFTVAATHAAQTPGEQWREQADEAWKAASKPSAQVDEPAENDEDSSKASPRVSAHI